MRHILLAALTLALMVPTASSAQTLGDFGGAASSFTVSVNPQYPVPHSKVTLSFLSGTINLTNATLTALVGGKQIYKGTVQPLAVTLGKAGSITTVQVTIASSGGSYNQTFSIQPQDVALVVEPISSAPPLYPGKSFVPLEGNVRVVAVANLRSAAGTALNPSTLSYVWTVDGAEIANASGIGKSAVIVASPLQYRSREVSVAVTSPNGDLVGGAELSLTALEPSVRLYENDPLLGIRYDRALSGTFSLRDAEATLYGAPFSLPTTKGSPFLQWFLNGDAAQTGSSITLRPTGNGEGRASLSLVASVSDYMKAATNLSISFGSAPSFNFFGL